MKKLLLAFVLFLLVLIFSADFKNISAQEACPSSEMMCSELDFNGGCSLPCIRVVTQSGGPGGRGASNPAQCQCQLSTNQPRTVPLGQPCQKAGDCAAPGQYCWGEFNQTPVCQELSPGASLNQRQNPSQAGETEVLPGPTCAEGNGINTAIGCIPFDDTNAFIGFILRWAIGVGGGIAFLLIIYAAFMIMSSQGNPERLKAGQELLTSAIAGLILLIFSIFILRIIGVNILGIF